MGWPRRNGVRVFFVVTVLLGDRYSPRLPLLLLQTHGHSRRPTEPTSLPWPSRSPVKERPIITAPPVHFILSVAAAMYFPLGDVAAPNGKYLACCLVDRGDVAPRTSMGRRDHQDEAHNPVRRLVPFLIILLLLLSFRREKPQHWYMRHAHWENGHKMLLQQVDVPFLNASAI